MFNQEEIGMNFRFPRRFRGSRSNQKSAPGEIMPSLLWFFYTLCLPFYGFLIAAIHATFYIGADKLIMNGDSNVRRVSRYRFNIHLPGTHVFFLEKRT